MKASAALAERIRQRILSRELPEGHRLPSERELCEQSNLSRTTVREALRSLELQGLIETKPGRGGGSLVCWRSGEVVQESIHLFIRGQQIKPESVVEVRELLEPLAARLAAERRADKDLVELGRQHAKMEASLSQPEAFLQANLNWHLAIASATGNDLLAAFLSALSQPIYEATDATFLNSDEVRMQTFRAHEAIMDAVVARDVEAAERRMRRHVSAYGEVMKKHPTKTLKASRAPRPRAARQAKA